MADAWQKIIAEAVKADTETKHAIVELATAIAAAGFDTLKELDSANAEDIDPERCVCVLLNKYMGQSVALQALE